MWIIIILVIGIFAGVLIYGASFPSEGQAEGIVTKVDVELHDPYQNPHTHMQMNEDRRAYRVYVSYTWEGREYEAKSFAAYGRAKYFPGDRVTVAVGKKDKNIVKILG